ncbi:MAG: hypothetical protein Q9191_006459 [Dirinaria sp. TL-2023a]
MLLALTFVVALLLKLSDQAAVLKPASLSALQSGNPLNGALFLNTNATNPQVLNETARYPIPDTSITLFLTDYGDRLNEQDLNVCLHDAEAFIVRQITLRGNSHMPNKRWRSNNVFLQVNSGAAMTLMVALEVIGALEDIVTEHHWTFATQVLVVDAQLGALGLVITGYWNTKSNTAPLKQAETRRRGM